MKNEQEVSAMQTTKEIVNGIWTLGREIYIGGKEGLDTAMEEETENRVRDKLDLKHNEKINLDDEKVHEIYKEEKRVVKKEARELGLRAILIFVGLGWLF